MGFLLQYSIITKQRPRVCNFDLEDYCGNGSIGNTCTNDTEVPNVTDMLITADATRDAFIKSVDEYFLASLAFFKDIDACNYSVPFECIYNSENLSECITPENYSYLFNLIYGPDGFFQNYYVNWIIEKSKWWNCLYPVGDVDKLNGVHTLSISIPDPINPGSIIINVDVDYTNYQTTSPEKYMVFRNSMGEMMQALKRAMQIISAHPLTVYYPTS
jgi:hypothetical protein